MSQFHIEIGANHIYCNLQNQQLNFIVQQQDNQDSNWNIVFKNGDDIFKELPKVLNNTQKVFNYLRKKPQQRLGFSPHWTDTERLISSQIQELGTLVVRIQVCDAIQSEVKLPIVRKFITILDKFQRRISVLETQKRVQQAQILNLNNKIKNYQQVQNKLERLIIQHKKTVQEYQKTIQDLKQKLPVQNKPANHKPILKNDKKQFNILQNYESSLFVQKMKQANTKATQKSKIYIAQNSKLKDKITLKKKRWQLDLSQQRLDAKDIQTLMLQETQTLSCNQIQVLNIGNNYFADEGIRTIFQFKWLGLKHLYIQDSQINSIQPLKKLFNLSQLVCLNIHLNYLKKDSVQIMLNTKWPKLQILSISFDEQCAQQCWVLLFKNMLAEMPVLNVLSIFNFQDINVSQRKSIFKWQKQKRGHVYLYNKEEEHVQNKVLILKQLSTKEKNNSKRQAQPETAITIQLQK